MNRDSIEAERASPGRGRVRSPAAAGVAGGLLAAMCCIGPAVGVAAGAGAGSLLLAAGDARFLLFGLGAVLALGVAGLLYLRGRRACPTPDAARAWRGRVLDVTLLAFGATYLLGRLVVPRVIDGLT